MIDIKLTSGPGSLLKNFRRFADDAVALERRYEARAGRPALAWLIIVVDVSERPSGDLERRINAARDETPGTLITLILKDQIERLQLPPLLRS